MTIAHSFIHDVAIAPIYTNLQQRDSNSIVMPHQRLRVPCGD